MEQDGAAHPLAASPGHGALPYGSPAECPEAVAGASAATSVQPLVRDPQLRRGGEKPSDDLVACSREHNHCVHKKPRGLGICSSVWVQKGNCRASVSTIENLKFTWIAL
ncbi:hypothetical protein ACQJBY_007926 [Aegilops geniculata]